MGKQKKIVTVALISSLLLFGGCNDNEVKGYMVIKNKNKTIKVIKDTKEILGDEIVVSKIDRYEKALGWDWFDDENVMLSKFEPTKMSFWSYELSSKKETSIEFLEFHKNNVSSYNILSPDKKHFFKVGDSSKTVLIEDINGNIKIEVDIGLGVDISYAKWLNNQEIVFPYIYGEGFYLINIDGTTSEIIVTSETMYTKKILGSIEKLDNKVYYLSEDNENNMMALKVYDIDTKEKKVLVVNEDIRYFELTPNESKIIFKKRTKGNKANELLLMNLDGTKRETLLKIPYSIIGYDLSPNGTKLVYGYRESDNDIDIIEVLDIKTNKKSQIFTGEKGYVQWLLRWSPSGEKIMFNTMNKMNGRVKNIEDREDFVNVISIK